MAFLTAGLSGVRSKLVLLSKTSSGSAANGRGTIRLGSSITPASLVRSNSNR